MTLGTSLPLAGQLGSLPLLFWLAWWGDGLLRRQRLPDARYVPSAAVVRSLGPLLWLQPEQGRRARIVVLDAKVMEPHQLSALKASLRLARYGRSGA